MKKVYIFLAEGFETIEALAPVDVLRRGGIDVVTVSITDSETVASSHKVLVKADTTFAKVNLSDGDAIILPGGFPGYANLGKSAEVGQTIKNYYNSGKLVAAICGAPTVLKINEIGEGKLITCHSSVVADMVNYNYTGTATATDGNLITADGAGHSIDFGCEILRYLTNDETVTSVRGKMELK